MMSGAARLRHRLNFPGQESRSGGGAKFDYFFIFFFLVRFDMGVSWG